MKFHILSNLHDGAWGGGNQFQKALKKYLNINDLYSDKIGLADVVLVNSHHWGDRFFEIFLIKKYNSNIIFLHRVDGPISTVRSDKKQIVVDKAIMRFNKAFADGTIYQSKWSRDKCIEQGMDDTKLQKVIHNAPDPSIFYKKFCHIKSKNIFPDAICTLASTDSSLPA